MPAYLVSYDLRNPHRDYSRLYTRLKDWGALRILESDYLIAHAKTNCIEIRDDLSKYIDNDDGLFVAHLTGEAAWRALRCADQDAKNKLNS